MAARNGESLIERLLCSYFGTLLPVRFADTPVQFGDIPALTGALDVFQCLQQDVQRLLRFPRHLIRLGKQGAEIARPMRRASRSVSGKTIADDAAASLIIGELARVPTLQLPENSNRRQSWCSLEQRHNLAVEVGFQRVGPAPAARLVFAGGQPGIGIEPCAGAGAERS